MKCAVLLEIVYMKKAKPPFLRFCFLSFILPNRLIVTLTLRHLLCCKNNTHRIADFFAAAAYVLKPGGRLAMVHRPFRLPDIMCMARNAGLEPKKMRLVVPHPGEAPNIVLMQFIKGAGKELEIIPELCIRDTERNYTEELMSIYR